VSNPVIYRYFSDKKSLPEIAENFEDLIKIVNNSHGKYDFQLREDYSNVYHRGRVLQKPVV
jgi:hypothetical protein